jgi:hypothetical protein
MTTADKIRKHLRYHRFSVVFLLCTLCAYFIYIFSQMLQPRADGLWAGHVHVWGDWSLHLAMGNIFAQKDPSEWFAYHPYYAGGKFTYGFLTNMISGLLMRAGWSLPAAFLIPSMIYSVLLVFGMYLAFYRLLKTRSAALTAVFLFFCSSGLGFLRFLPDLYKRPTLEHLLWPTIDYSRIETPYQWLAGNWVNGMLVPQRAYLLGMTISVWVLAGIFTVYFSPNVEKQKPLTKGQKILLVVCGLFAGILPITHMHSLIVLVIVGALLGLILIKQWQKLLWYAVPAGILSTILYMIFVKGGIQNPEFMEILIGWTAPLGSSPFEHFLNWIKMWWEIWGPVLPVSIVGMWIAMKKLPLPNSVVLASGFVIFALGNLIRFQPIHWDNSKLFMWAYFFFAGLMTLVLQKFWRRTVGHKTFAILLAITLTLTGCIELYRLLRFDQQAYIMGPNEDIEVGKLINQYTDPKAIFLVDPSHNHPAMVWGSRPILLGYTAWAWNFGFLYREREADIAAMYDGGPRTEDLLKKYKISYVGFGPTEMANHPGKEGYFSQRFPLYLKSNSFRFYDVRSLTGGP